MVTRAVGALLTVGGLTLVLVGLMLGVLLGPDGAWSATAHLPAGRSAVVVTPALASVLGPHVRVSATSEQVAPLFVGRARADDADAYVSGTSYARAGALDGPQALRLQGVEGARRLVAPDGVDIWQQAATGQLGWTPRQGAQAIVVTTASGGPLPAIDLAVAWRDGSWWAIPALAVLAGAGLLALAWRVRA